MQHQGHVTGGGGARTGSLPGCTPQLEVACGGNRRHDEFRNGNPEPLRHRDRRRRTARVDHEEPCCQILQVKLEFIRGVPGIQRRCGGTGGDSQEGHSHFGAIGQHYRHDVVATHTKEVKRFNSRSNLVTEGCVAEVRAARRRNRWRWGGPSLQQFNDGLGSVHDQFCHEHRLFGRGPPVLQRANPTVRSSRPDATACISSVASSVSASRPGSRRSHFMTTLVSATQGHGRSCPHAGSTPVSRSELLFSQSTALATGIPRVFGGKLIVMRGSPQTQPDPGTSLCQQRPAPNLCQMN